MAAYTTNTPSPPFIDIGDLDWMFQIKMLEGDKREGNRGHDDNGTSSTPEIQGTIIETNKHQNACITKIGPWGGIGGSYKDIKVTPVCLKTITIRSGRFVYSLSFSYNDEHGIEHHVGPWGIGDYLTDGITNKIQFGPEDFLIGVFGTIGSSLPYLMGISGTDVIDLTILHSLTFITNARQYGPFGGPDGTPFHSPLIGSNSSIVGFFGRSGDVVDAIGLYVNIEREPMEKHGSITKFGLWGGDSGMHYDVEVLPRRLISMVVCSGKVIDSLTFIYNDRDGRQYTSGPWGGLGTSKKGGFHTIMLGHSEIVKEVSGTVGLDNVNEERLTSLFFVTNIATYGPFGDKVGMPFRSPLQDNDSIVGFFAKVGKNINAIGFYLASIEKKDNNGAACTDRRLEDDITKLDKAFITKIGPWGGSKGNHKDIEVPPLCLNNITILSGEVIFSIAYSYKDNDRKQQHAGPWGASEGFSYGTFDTIHLEPLECLTKVSGTIDYSSKYSSDVVTSLIFITNARQYGPYGGGGGIPFHSPVLSSGNIVGFFAHAERVVDAIGLYVNTHRQPTKEQVCTQDSVMKIGPWGGCKGNPKDLEVAPLCLNSVTIRSGEVVFSIAFSYTDGDGKQQHAGPWGASEGFSYGTFDTIQLEPLECLTEVSGTVDYSSKYSSDVVTSVMFITNAHRFGPYGGGGGIPFHSPVLSSGNIVGFFAHAERVVDAIGLYVNTERQPTKEQVCTQDLVMKIGPWGSDSGMPNYVDVLPRRLIRVVVHSGKVINSLTFTYSDCNGQEHTAGPWGRTGEPLEGTSHTILFGQSDFLMEVSGTIGRSSSHSDVVTSLLFVTNTGSYGPHGEGGGARFRSPLQANGSIVGFFVNAEDVIHAIGVYIRPQRDASRDRVDIHSASSALEDIILDGSLEPTNVRLEFLQHITEDFSEKRKIGKGGFAVVYEGVLQNGSSVAVKRLLNSHTIDETLFHREAISMISVKHENIVRLLGYCANTEGQAMPNPNKQESVKFIFSEVRERLLCSEYIKNGSLDKYIADELRGLEWHTRYGIIEGICKGLDYLHNEKSITHRDLKPANILVDDLMVPKITDFGTSKLLEGATHAVTGNSAAMSFGYTAPEFIRRREVSFKSDVYSLGVIIMELVTGLRRDPDINNVLRRWRHRWNKSGKYPPLGRQQVTRCIEIASRCLSDSPKKRPHVRDILCMLNAIESTDDQTSNTAGESPVGLISPYPWELIEFDKLELNFPFEINKQIPCSLELTNATDDDVAFDVHKTGMLRYCIEPNRGVVPARSKRIVIVTLQPRKEAPSGMMCKDEFAVVRCAAVNEGLITAEDIHDDMFDSKLVDEVTLSVVFPSSDTITK